MFSLWKVKQNRPAGTTKTGRKRSHYNQKTKLWRYLYTITDDNFIETISGEEGYPVDDILFVKCVGLAKSVIEVYNKRGLSVGVNLLAAFFWFYRNTRNPALYVHKAIESNKKYNPQYKQYEQEVEKYLILL